MVSPYRAGEPPKALSCPRCTKKLPPMDVAKCEKGCGTWVSQFAATEVLSDVDRRRDPVTRWWRVRAPCPVCTEQMLLYGDDPGLLQGCEIHGYFIDADMIVHTNLARGVDQAALERKREDTARVDAERDALYAKEQALEEERKQRMRRNVGVGDNEIARLRAMQREEESRAEADRARLADLARHAENTRNEAKLAAQLRRDTARAAEERATADWRNERSVQLRAMLPPATSDAFVKYIVDLEERLARLEKRRP